MNPHISILIVDDQPLGQETVASLLSPLGYQLIFASNGPEALRLASATPPDLILLDVMMPGMDGYEVCRRLRDSVLLAEVPVIMLTALDDRDSRLRGIEAGADDFISKPYDRVELRMRVRTITRLNRYRRLVGERTKFEWVVEHADDGYLVVAANGMISYANSRARLYLGLQPEGQFDTPFLDLATSQYRLEPDTSWEDWFGSPATEHTAPRMLIRPATGTANSFMLHVELLDMVPDPEPRCLVRLRDVTESLASQRSVWSFQALIRHKLNTSLSQLIGGMRLIEELDLAPADGMFAEMLSITMQSANRLHSDISDIFRYIAAPELLRSEYGGCAVADLPSIIADINANLAITTLRVQEISKELSAAGDLAISRHGLQLIFGELLENARKFHPGQKPTIDISITRHNDAIGLHILDDGLTLAPDQLARVWLPYCQGERVFTGQVPGMGLGLPMVAHLLWQIGGSCRMSNRVPGPGLDVEIRIPLVEHAAG
ncbi:MAG: response regulator [Roseiflexaceae bacterium]|nr:response regulator [Roseiflexaceae bacterium]